MPERIDAAGRKARVAIFVSGTGTNMAALVYASRLASASYEVVLVASNRPDAPALRLAQAEGIATFALSHAGMDREAHDIAMEEAAASARTDLIALAGYMRIVTNSFAMRWEGRMLNIHPSLLPRYRGLDTHARALAAGDGKAGASVHLVTPELDGGRVLEQGEVAILPGDTAETLANRVRLVEHQLYPFALNRHCETLGFRGGV